mgnify:CR=1 FL=1
MEKEKLREFSLIFLRLLLEEVLGFCASEKFFRYDLPNELLEVKM